MSLTDPTTRWWNRDSTRRAAAYVCWIVGIGLALYSSWTLWGTSGTFDGSAPTWFVIVSAILPIPLLIAGVFLYLFSVESDQPSGRALSFPLAAYFIAIGLGGLFGQAERTITLVVMNAIFVVGGVIAMVVAEVATRRGVSNAQLRDRVERSGVTTRGRVTRARSYFLNHHAVTRVTVEFTDTDGQRRWASQTVAGEVRTGSMLNVRYSPSDLSRKAAVVISR